MRSTASSFSPFFVAFSDEELNRMLTRQEGNYAIGPELPVPADRYQKFQLCSLLDPGCPQTASRLQFFVLSLNYFPLPISLGRQGLLHDVRHSWVIAS